MLTLISACVVALITAIIGPIAVDWAKRKMEKSPETTPMYDALEVGTLIDSQIESMLHDLDCDRIWVAQFHNGGYFYPTGRSIQKFSIFHERITPGTPTLQTTFQNIPVSLFPKALSKIYSETELAIEDITSTTDALGLESLTTQYGTNSICMVGLYSLNNHLIGVMGISFSESHVLSHEEWIIIRQKVGVIGTLISEYLYQTNKK